MDHTLNSILLEGNMWEYIHDITVGKDLLNRTAKALTFPMKQNTDILDYNKMKSFCLSKDIIKEAFTR